MGANSTNHQRSRTQGSIGSATDALNLARVKKVNPRICQGLLLRVVKSHAILNETGPYSKYI